MGRVDAVSYGNKFDINKDKVVNERDVKGEFALKFAKLSRNERIQYIGYMSSGVRKTLARVLYTIANDPRRTEIPAGDALTKNPGDPVFSNYEDGSPPMFDENLLWKGPEADRVQSNIDLSVQALKNLAAQSTEAVDYLTDQLVRQNYVTKWFAFEVVHVLEYAFRHGAPKQKVIKSLERIINLDGLYDKYKGPVVHQVADSAGGVLWNIGIRTYGEPVWE